MIDIFRRDVEKAGYRFDGQVIADDAWHRCYFGDEKKSSGRYRLKLLDDKFALGNFGSDKDSEGFRSWHSKTSAGTYSPEDRAAYRRQLESEKKTKEAEREKQQDLLARKLEKFYNGLPEANAGMDYLYRKKLGTHGIKMRGPQELVVPIYMTDGRLWNLQSITPGFKKFCKGAKIKGGYFPFGEYKSGRLVLAEGWATSASIYQATEIPTFATFTAGNLEPVAMALKKKYPAAQIVIAADNDVFTMDAKGKPWNPGIEYARRAARVVGGAKVVWPEFVGNTEKLTDFNDLHVLHGLDAVREKIIHI